jgi:hypothetical protein
MDRGRRAESLRRSGLWRFAVISLFGAWAEIIEAAARLPRGVHLC